MQTCAVQRDYIEVCTLRTFKMAKEAHDILDSCEPVPVKIETSPNKQFTPFDYAKCNIPGPGADINDFLTQLNGCNCTLTCKLGRCECLMQFDENYDSRGSLLHTVTFNEISKPMIECNSNCKCSNDCINRQAQHGIRIPLCVYLTENKGWGLKTLTYIPKNKFVCEYAGEIVNYDEAKMRTKNLKGKDNYLLAVLEHLSDSRTVKTYVDPRQIGNAGRFINHSCDPNLTMVLIRVDNAIPKICLFSNRDILPNDELTFNYSGDIGCPQGQTSDKENEKKRCFCMSDKCTGLLPYCHTIFD